jgi:hypothetical protein
LGSTAYTFASARDDGNQFIGWYYQGASATNAGKALDRGWWGLEYLSANEMRYLAISSTKAAEGPGHLYIPAGHYAGGDAFSRRYYIGYANEMLNRTLLNNGIRNQGDIFHHWETGAAGHWTGYIVKSDGQVGEIWSSGSTYSPTIGKNGEPISRVVPSNTRRTDLPQDAGRGIAPAMTPVFKCVQGGTAGLGPSGEPDWLHHLDGAPFYDDGVGGEKSALRWVHDGDYPAFNAVGFVDDPVISYRPQAKILWADTTATDGATSAKRATVRGQRFTATINPPNSDRLLASFVIPNDVACSFNATVIGKIPGTTNALVNKLAGAYVNNGGTITRLGPDEIGVAQGNGSLVDTTFRLNINMTNIEVFCTPPALAAGTNWTVVVENFEVSDSDSNLP